MSMPDDQHSNRRPLRSVRPDIAPPSFRRPGSFKPEPPKTEPASKKATKTLEIKISLPPLPKLPPILKSLRLPALRKATDYSKSPAKFRTKLSKLSRRSALTAGAIATIAVVSLGYYFTQSKDGANTAASADTADTAQKPPGIVRGDPTYRTLAPAGKDIADLGGWARISPPGKDPVYAFADKIGGIGISVSQQPLPQNLKSDTEAQIKKLAGDFNATEKVTAGDTILYMGTSVDGPQSVIFSKSGLLILIKSASQIPNGQWVTYVDSLR